MGPRSDNRGYVGKDMVEANGEDRASMGPRSDNRGYGSRSEHWVLQHFAMAPARGSAKATRTWGFEDLVTIQSPVGTSSCGTREG